MKMSEKALEKMKELEAAGWKRYRSCLHLGRRIFIRASTREGITDEYRTVFSGGRVLPGCYEQ